MAELTTYTLPPIKDLKLPSWVDRKKIKKIKVDIGGGEIDAYELEQDTPKDLLRGNTHAIEVPSRRRYVESGEMVTIKKKYYTVKKSGTLTVKQIDDIVVFKGTAVLEFDSKITRAMDPEFWGKE